MVLTTVHSGFVASGLPPVIDLDDDVEHRDRADELASQTAHSVGEWSGCKDPPREYYDEKPLFFIRHTSHIGYVRLKPTAGWCA